MMDTKETHRQQDNPALAGLLASITEFRDRVTRASALIADLRRRNEELERMLAGKEASHRELRAEMEEKDFRILELEEQLRKTPSLSSAGIGIDAVEKLFYLSPDEREALERQIGDLITRIDAHLG